MERSEEMVSEKLKKLKIEHILEKPVLVIDENKKLRIWTPDFFLPEFGIYIEVCGKERKDYKFRKKTYEENKIKVIFIQVYKKGKWHKYMIEEIRRISEKRNEILKNSLMIYDQYNQQSAP